MALTGYSKRHSGKGCHAYEMRVTNREQCAHYTPCFSNVYVMNGWHHELHICSERAFPVPRVTRFMFIVHVVAASSNLVLMSTNKRNTYHCYTNIA